MPPCPVSPVGRLGELAALTHRICSVLLVASVLRDVLGKVCHGPGKGWVCEPQGFQDAGQGSSCCAVQCLWVAADFQPPQYLQGYFSSRATNPMCRLFKGMLFLLVQIEARSSKAGFQRDPRVSFGKAKAKES